MRQLELKQNEITNLDRLTIANEIEGEINNLSTYPHDQESP